MSCGVRRAPVRRSCGARARREPSDDEDSSHGAPPPAASADRWVSAGDRGSCRERSPGRRYVEALRRALLSGLDVWGNALLASPHGPSYEQARSYLTPLLLGHALDGPHCLRRALRAVLVADRRPRRTNGRPPRRRRQSDHLRARGREDAHRRCRSRRTGALRIVPCPARVAPSRQGLPPDPRDPIRRRRRRPLPAGVVRGADPGSRRAGELREAQD